MLKFYFYSNPDHISTACLQNTSNVPTNDETISIGDFSSSLCFWLPSNVRCLCSERMQSNIASLPYEIGRLLEGTLRNIEEQGINLADRLGCIERKMEDLQKGVSAGLQDICNDIRDTVGLVQLDACQIQQIRQMHTNRYTTRHSNSQALENLKSTIRSKGTVSVISPLPSNEEVVDHTGPEVPETVTVTQKQARTGTASATTKTKGKTARKIMERSKERHADEEDAAESGRYSEAVAKKKMNGGKTVKTRSRVARAAPY